MGEGIPGNDMTVVNFWQRFREGRPNQIRRSGLILLMFKVNLRKLILTNFILHLGRLGSFMALFCSLFTLAAVVVVWLDGSKFLRRRHRLEELGFMGLSGGVWIVIGVWVLLTLTQVILIKLLPEAIALCAKAEEEDQKSVWKYPVAVWIVDKL